MREVHEEGEEVSCENNPFAFPSGDEAYDDPGMSLRDYFAARAPKMNEVWARKNIPEGGHLDTDTAIALEFKWRFFWADGMLKARQG